MGAQRENFKKKKNKIVHGALNNLLGIANLGCVIYRYGTVVSESLSLTEKEHARRH